MATAGTHEPILARAGGFCAATSLLVAPAVSAGRLDLTQAAYLYPKNLTMKTVMKSFGQAVLWMAVFSTQAWAQIPFTVQPMGGVYNVDYAIGNYVDQDLDVGVNETKDYKNAVGGAAFTYDGHDAIDMGPPNFAGMDRGMPVYAVADGSVTFVRDRMYDRCTGNCSVGDYNGIEITHTNGFKTGYYHLARNSALVNEGDTVVAGQLIGLLGSAGQSSGPHLHFTVFSNGSAVETYLSPSFYWTNPLPYAGEGVRVLDSGFTHQTPTNVQLQDRPSDNDVYYQSDGANQLARMWLQVHSVAATDTINYQLFRPNNTQSANFNYPNGLANWGLHYVEFGLPAIPDLGVWRAEVRANGTLIKSKTFTVVAAPQTRTWAASNSFSFWSNAGNWSGNAVPGAGEDVRITPSDGISRSIFYDLAGGPTLKQLFLDLTGPGANRATFSNGGHDISLIDSLIVGDTGRATFNHVGGRITTANPNLDVAIGWHDGSHGIYNMSGNAALYVAHSLYVGTGGALAQGTFNQSSGTTTTVAHVVVGNLPFSYGYYNLSGGTLNIGDTLYVASNGQGDVSVTGRSQLITRNGATLGYYVGSHGTLTIDGNRTFWDRVPGSTGSTIVGRQGTGTLNIRNGATVNTGSVILGEFASGTGTVNVSGNTQWNTSLTVGSRGIGNLNITGSARVEAGTTLSIGDLASSQGTVVVDGSFLSANEMWIGYRGSGRVTVSNDARLSAGNIHIGEVTGVGRLTVLSSGDVLALTTYVGLLGTLDGDSYVRSDIRNYGVVHPATSPTDPGTLVVEDYIQEASGALRISLASATDYSQLNTIPLASMTLNGTLYVEALSGFVPFQGEVFQILNSNNISGTFSFLQLPTLSSGLYWYTNDLYTTGAIRIAGNGVDGDFTSDGYVDSRDYIVWRKGQGSQAQYDQWRANFGRESTGAGSSVNVPEPSSLMLCLLAGVVLHLHAGRPMRSSTTWKATDSR